MCSQVSEASGDGVVPSDFLRDPSPAAVVRKPLVAVQGRTAVAVQHQNIAAGGGNVEPSGTSSSRYLSVSSNNYAFDLDGRYRQSNPINPLNLPLQLRFPTIAPNTLQTYHTFISLLHRVCASSLNTCSELCSCLSTPMKLN